MFPVGQGIWILWRLWLFLFPSLFLVCRCWRALCLPHWSKGMRSRWEMLLEGQEKDAVSLHLLAPHYTRTCLLISSFLFSSSLWLFLLPNEKPEPTSSLELSARVETLLSPFPHHPCFSLWSHSSVWTFYLIHSLHLVFYHSTPGIPIPLLSPLPATVWPWLLTSLMLKCWHAHTAQLYVSGGGERSFSCCGFGVVFGRPPPSPP